MEIKKLIIYLTFINIFVVFFIDKIAHVYNVFDQPNKRKLHKKKISLLGGPLILLNLFFIFFQSFLTDNEIFEKIFNFSKLEFYYLFFTSVLIFFVGFIDDKKGLLANIKLIAISFILLQILFLDDNLIINILKFGFNDYSFSLEKISIFFTLFCFLLFMNAFNMFDGIDLQASLYALFLLIIILSKSTYTNFVIILIIQIFFILYLNFKKKIFLGDSGSLLLSFLLGSLIIKSYNNNLNVFLADEIFLIMLLPGLELLRLAIFRILKKKHPFVADNEHIHHYLLNRYNFVKTTIIIQSIYIFPIIFYYSFNNIFYSISILIIYYGFVIYKNSSN
mgnify:CR=1 FL=1